jgi:hypothetical protein
MIDLVLDKGKVQFEIAHDAIERSNIRQLRVKISPEYPTIARKMNLKGAVQLEALVGRDGWKKSKCSADIPCWPMRWHAPSSSGGTNQLRRITRS